MKPKRRSQSEGKPLQASPTRRMPNIHGKKIDKITELNMQAKDFDGKTSIYAQDYNKKQQESPEKLPVISKRRSQSTNPR